MTDADFQDDEQDRLAAAAARRQNERFDASSAGLARRRLHLEAKRAALADPRLKKLWHARPKRKGMSPGGRPETPLSAHEAASWRFLAHFRRLFREDAFDLPRWDVGRTPDPRTGDLTVGVLRQKAIRSKVVKRLLKRFGRRLPPP